MDRISNDQPDLMLTVQKQETKGIRSGALQELNESTCREQTNKMKSLHSPLPDFKRSEESENKIK